MWLQGTSSMLNTSLMVDSGERGQCLIRDKQSSYWGSVHSLFLDLAMVTQYAWWKFIKPSYMICAVWLVPWLHFCDHDRMPWKRQIRGEKALFWLTALENIWSNMMGRYVSRNTRLVLKKRKCGGGGGGRGRYTERQTERQRNHKPWSNWLYPWCEYCHGQPNSLWQNLIYFHDKRFRKC